MSWWGRGGVKGRKDDTSCVRKGYRGKAVSTTRRYALVVAGLAATAAHGMDPAPFSKKRTPREELDSSGPGPALSIGSGRGRSPKNEE